MHKPILKLFTFYAVLNAALCWDTDQLEVFDVVEEVGTNFYEILNVTQDATSKDIRSGFKRQSLVLHPDKNLEEDTSEKFRHLVAVYEVLRDENKRKHYDDVLVNGMPNWKSAMFYYRRVRKVGLFEGGLMVFFILTIGQYLVAWAAYFEQKFTIEQNMKYKTRRNVQPIVIEIPKPSVFNTLPFQLPKLVYWTILSIPTLLSSSKELIKIKVEEALKEPEIEEKVIVEPRVRKRKTQGFKIPEGPNFESNLQNGSLVESDEGIRPAVAPTPVISGGFWTDDDLNELVQLVKKHPGGTPKRWEIIAEAIGRSVPEVTFMANKLKSIPLRTGGDGDKTEPEEEIKAKTKTKGGKLLNDDGEKHANAWTQTQQKALEDALIKYPKGCLDRWDRIADCVQHKKKEECIYRYKQLVELVKTKMAQ